MTQNPTLVPAAELVKRNNATQPEFLHWEYVKANFGGLFAKWD